MSFSPPYRYMDANQLASELRLRAEQPRKIAVVDVRDDDYEGGHIVGAIHAPSSTFLDRVDSLVGKELQGYEQVVFHCSLSQQRGPKSARIYRETRDAAQSSGRVPSSEQEVFVLRDGFSNFGPKFKNDKDLVEDWDDEAWLFR